MFGMGGTEILVILVVALLFLGPDKLPEAAKTISKGIRDLRKQTRDLQNTIEADTDIGGAIRDIKSALRGEEPRPVRPAPRPAPLNEGADTAAALASAATQPAVAAVPPAPIDAPGEAFAPPGPPLPDTAGESDASASDDGGDDLRDLIRPAPGAVAKNAAGDSGRSDT